MFAAFDWKDGGPVSSGRLIMNGKDEVEGDRVQNLSSGANGFGGSTVFDGGG
jgi:hypothetical protein